MLFAVNMARQSVGPSDPPLCWWNPHVFPAKSLKMTWFERKIGSSSSWAQWTPNFGHAQMHFKCTTYIRMCTDTPKSDQFLLAQPLSAAATVLEPPGQSYESPPRKGSSIWPMNRTNTKSGWWLTYPSEKWWSESQLGWWHSQYMENNPFMFQTTNQ